MGSFKIINEFKDWKDVDVDHYCRKDKNPYFLLTECGIIRGVDIDHITFRFYVQLPRDLYDFYMDSGLHILNMVSSVGINGRNAHDTIITYKNYSCPTNVFNDYDPKGKDVDEIKRDINKILSRRMAFIKYFYDRYNSNKLYLCNNDKNKEEQETEECVIHETGISKIDVTVNTILQLLDNITVPKSLSEEVYIINTARRDLSRLLSLCRESGIDKEEDKIEETFKLLNKMLTKIEKFGEFIKNTMSREFNTEIAFLNIKYDRI